MPSREKKSYVSNILRESFQSISRNTLMSSVTIISIMAALIILGVFLVFSANIAEMTKSVEDNLEIKVFLKEGVTQEQKDALYAGLKESPYVTDITFESKSQAMDNFADSLKDYTGLLNSYNSSSNPLPESYSVKADDGEHLAAIRDLAEQYTDSVEYVKYEQNYITSLMRFNNFIKIGSVALIVIMSVISLFLIYNTIRLTVVNRRREIEIMKYIGATDAYIQTPFVLEGTFLGFFATIVSTLVIRLTYFYILGVVNGNILMSAGLSLVSPTQITWIVLLSFSIYGILIGAVGALIATRKFLDV